MTLDEDAQARFLIAEARRATALDLDCDADIPVLLDATLDLTERVLAGDTALLPDLIRFLDDPEMERDFMAIFNRTGTGTRASAANDLVAYAAGFTARMMAERTGFGSVPDPVNEARAWIWDYYRDQSAFLGLAQSQ
ncbi:hypothetical protein [Primorskyibacter flagellatus]|nr:hypothetical protein [Primorskyibacter flagellatus]